MSKASGHWLISTQVSKDGSDLDGKLPSTKDDAAYLLDEDYFHAGVRGSKLFRPEWFGGKYPGVWAVVLYKDRHLNSRSAARAAAVVAYFKPWLPPWHVSAPAPAASSSRPTRKSSRS